LGQEFLELKREGAEKDGVVIFKMVGS